MSSRREEKLMKLYKWQDVAVEQLGGGVTRQDWLKN